MPETNNRSLDPFARRLREALRRPDAGRTAPLAGAGSTSAAPVRASASGRTRDPFSARVSQACRKTPVRTATGAADATASTAANAAAAGVAGAARSASASAPAPASASTRASASTATAALAAQPVGSGEQVVEPGDCVLSLASECGHLWETLWNDAANVELRMARGEAGVLLPGDRVAIPKKQTRQEAGASEARHRFVVRGAAVLVRVRLLDGDKPLANLPYVLETPGERFEGTTDAGGHLEQEVSGGTRQCRLILNGRDEHIIRLGHLDPADSVSGVQARLNNLGFDCGRVDGVTGAATRSALERFQRAYGLGVTGDADAATQQKLRQIHDTDAIR